MREFQWICEQLADVDQLSGLTGASVALNALTTIWRTPEMYFWDIFYLKGDS